MSRVATAVVVVALLVAGCSGFSGGTGSQTATTTWVSSGTATDAPADAETTALRTMSERRMGVFISLTRVRADVPVDESSDNASTKLYEDLPDEMRAEFDEALEGDEEVQRSWNATVRYVKYDDVWFSVRRQEVN